jgi:hypothetical protein
MRVDRIPRCETIIYSFLLHCKNKVAAKHAHFASEQDLPTLAARVIGIGWGKSGRIYLYSAGRSDQILLVAK